MQNFGMESILVFVKFNSFYWKLTKFSEISSQEKSKNNDYPLILLPYFEATQENVIEMITERKQLSVDRDSILLYNRDFHYCPGSTPSVCFVPSTHWEEFLKVWKNSQFKK